MIGIGIRWHLREVFPAAGDVQTLLDIIADPRC